MNLIAYIFLGLTTQDVFFHGPKNGKDELTMEYPVVKKSIVEENLQVSI